MEHEDSYEKALELLIKAEVSEEEGIEIIAGVIDEWMGVEEEMRKLSEMHGNSMAKA